MKGVNGWHVSGRHLSLRHPGLVPGSTLRRRGRL